MLEEKLKKATANENARIADYFDLIAGTSTGGILACAYLCPDQKDPLRPKFTAQEVVNLYLERATSAAPTYSDMDDASQENLNALKELGTETAQIFDNQLDEFVKLLV